MLIIKRSVTRQNSIELGQKYNNFDEFWPYLKKNYIFETIRKQECYPFTLCTF